ncbi:MAG: hypothetical protein COA86_08595 [Kangiella sp.]|nr:MAG: hypothetical protein COA86_08595 [Kangiella sp.]
MKFLLIIIANLSVVACAASNLIVNKPLNDKVYLYGLGIHSTHASAEKQAMANLTQQLSSRVESEVLDQQTLTNGIENSRTEVNTKVSTLALELPNIETMKSIEINGEWNILIRVKRSLVQLAIKNQLEDKSDDFSIYLEDYSASPGPACWYALKGVNNEKSAFRSLIAAYVGSGVKVSRTQIYSEQIKGVEKLFKKCKKRNRYRLQVENDLTGQFRAALQESLSSSEIKLTNSSKNTGVIVAKLEKETKILFKQHVVFLSSKLIVKDEFGNFISDTDLKAKGVSFSSYRDAEKKAIKGIIKRIRKLKFSI